MKIHKNIKVEGKVQGVWYRDSTRKKANLLGLAGTVINLPNGAVSIEVEGCDEAIMNEFMEWLYEGSENAEVTRVVVDDGDWKGMDGFEILKG